MEKKPYPSETQERFIVRFTEDGMRDRIAEAAKAAGRSMNAEIVHRLQESFATKSWPLPSAILSKAEEAAASKGRTVDAELFDRVLESFADRPEEVIRLRTLLEEERKRNSELRQSLLREEAEDTLKNDVLYILLDTNGYPISWDEINAYLDEVKRKSGKLPSSWHTSVITPDMESSSRRTEQVLLLTRKLRDTGISQAVGRGTRLPTEDSAGGIEDAKITALKVPVTVRGKKTEVVIRKERTDTLGENGKSVLELLNELDADSKNSHVMRKKREEQMAAEKSSKKR
jgi:hypothetical protein